jgi:hypothetical protein
MASPNLDFLDIVGLAFAIAGLVALGYFAYQFMG